jgi:hypothetical protein
MSWQSAVTCFEVKWIDFEEIHMQWILASDCYQFEQVPEKRINKFGA